MRLDGSGGDRVAVNMPAVKRCYDVTHTLHETERHSIFHLWSSISRQEYCLTKQSEKKVKEDKHIS